MATSRKPSPAMIVALLALVLALTGTAIAAIGNNSIGADELGPVKLRSNERPVPPRGTAKAKVQCKRGEQLLGGGATLPDSDPEEQPSVEQSGPVSPRKWLAAANNSDSDLVATLRVTAICLTK